MGIEYMVMSDRVRTVEDKTDDREDSHSAQHTAHSTYNPVTAHST